MGTVVGTDRFGVTIRIFFIRARKRKSTVNSTGTDRAVLLAKGVSYWLLYKAIF